MAALFDVPTIGMMFLIGGVFGWPDAIESPLDPVFSLIAIPTWFVIGYLIGVADDLARR